MNPVAEDILMHYGMPKRSGRYPWGSGENPYQHSGDFLSRADKLKKQGLSETEIAKSMGLTTTQYRTQKALAKDERRALDVATARGLREKGYSLNEIAKKMGYNNDSSVRSLLNEKSEARMKEARNAYEFLKEQVDTKGMIDVGVGVEQELGISKEKLNQALYMLEMDGYNTFGGGVPQTTNPGKQTNLKVLCPPDTPYKINDKGQKVSSAIYDYENIHSVRNYVSYDGGQTFKKGFVYPESLDSKRLKVRYAEDGGIKKDGLIELRRGVEDISLGNSIYSQVRIMVNGTHYIKGMAVYSDDMPDGVDVIFNTNKKKGTPMLGPKDNTVLKNIKNDPDNPFGSLIKEHGGQRYYDDPNGKYIDPITGKKQSLSLINKRSDEADWSEWKDAIPSQFLSKQNRSLAKRQLGLAADDKHKEFEDICSLTNPTVKKQLLETFSNDCDSAAVHLQAAAFPRQKYHVILPMTTIKDTEVYAPNYKDGEHLALVRYPHGGTFEIPILKVNNKIPEGQKMMGKNPADAIGISSKVAERLSGADFDGDTVMAIPTGGKINITSTKELKGLKDFDPKMEYPYHKGMKIMGDTQNQMGKISNLITDMTLKGAKEDELARAVRHSMVVIDAEKHRLDYKQSEIDNGIASLKKKYQGHIDPKTGKYSEGASTLISKAKSKEVVLKRQGTPKIDPDTGKLIYKEVREEYIDPKTGKVKIRTQNSTKMAETDDAYSLISDLNTPMERLYADYANDMKSLANKARKEMVNTGKVAYSPSAKETYLKEVKSLESKLSISEMNAPRERQAQLMSNAVVAAKKKAYKEEHNGDKMPAKDVKKIGQQSLTAARNKVGAKRTPIDISDREWEAIQAGAISENKLKRILKYSDIDKVRERATPRTVTTVSPAKASKIAAMKASGHTTAEIAEATGLSPSTVSKYLKDSA